jgi:hypothetical protein
MHLFKMQRTLGLHFKQNYPTGEYSHLSSMDGDTIGYTIEVSFDVMTGGIPNEKNIIPDSIHSPFSLFLQRR